MNIKPIGNRLLVKAIKEEEMTKSGIILPETIDKEKKAQGEIVALGIGKKLARLELKAGDKVIFSKYAGEEIKMDNEDFKILNYDEVLAVIEN